MVSAATAVQRDPTSLEKWAALQDKLDVDNFIVGGIPQFDLVLINPHDFILFSIHQAVDGGAAISIVGDERATLEAVCGYGEGVISCIDGFNGRGDKIGEDVGAAGVG